MSKEHKYIITTRWTGNRGEGTINYTAYGRDHSIGSENKIEIPCSAEPAFRGDSTKYNPEELLVASLSGCHMLWYLHLCADAGIIVCDYTDNAEGKMEITSKGSGRFTEVTLHPKVVVKEPSMIDKASELHKKAHEFCFIANSINFIVNHEPNCSSVIKEKNY